MRSPFPGETAQYSPPQRELRYAIYVRKSTEAEERQILSIETQIRKARELDASLQTAAVFEERHSAFEPGKRPALPERGGRRQAHLPGTQRNHQGPTLLLLPLRQLTGRHHDAATGAVPVAV